MIKNVDADEQEISLFNKEDEVTSSIGGEEQDDSEPINHNNRDIQNETPISDGLA